MLTVSFILIITRQILLLFELCTVNNTLIMTIGFLGKCPDIDTQYYIDTILHRQIILLHVLFKMPIVFLTQLCNYRHHC